MIVNRYNQPMHVQKWMEREWLLHLAAAGAALGMALIAQYGFQKFPCHLCLLQRYPYAAVLVLALLMRRQTARRALWRGLIVMAYLATAGIAAYHVGVEQGWIAGPSGCSAGPQDAGNIEALRAQIMGAALVSCKDAADFLFGISMAAWNALYAAALGMGTIWLWKKRHFQDQCPAA